MVKKIFFFVFIEQIYVQELLVYNLYQCGMYSMDFKMNDDQIQLIKINDIKDVINFFFCLWIYCFKGIVYFFKFV